MRAVVDTVTHHLARALAGGLVERQDVVWRHPVRRPRPAARSGCACAPTSGPATAPPNG
jgi:hypothetical protein